MTEQDFEILDENIIQTMDYIIRGLALGKFDETSKKVEFLSKLSGEDTPRYIAKLLERINRLETDVLDLRNDQVNDRTHIITLETSKTNIEAKIIALEADMRNIALALRQIFEPKPLRNNFDLSNIDSFCNKHGAPSY